MAGKPVSDSYSTFLSCYDSNELREAKDILTARLPFISSGLCPGCNTMMSNRIGSISSGAGSVSSTDNPEEMALPAMNLDPEGPDMKSSQTSDSSNNAEGASSSAAVTHSQACKADIAEASSSGPLSVAVDVDKEGKLQNKVTKKKQEGHVKKTADKTAPASGRKKRSPKDDAEYHQFMGLKVLKDMVFFETVNAKQVNILQGLELYSRVFSAVEQKLIVELVYEFRDKGRRGELRELTHIPANAINEVACETMQFGCYSEIDSNQSELLIDPLPPLLKAVIKRLVRWHIIPTVYVPNCCVVTLFDKGDSLPPQIYRKEVVRPFCIVSFESDECQILFERHFPLKFHPGSVIVFNGNAADVAKHSVPPLSKKWILITFWRENESNQPSSYLPEPDLANIKPLPYDPIQTVRSVFGSENLQELTR